jgi:arylsulfatase A
MNRREFLAAAAGAAVSHAQQRTNRPNIILVLTDDLGYGDVGCFGNTAVRTPHLDRLARDGIRFTNCYSAAANCSPARSALMTGRTPTRLGIHNWIPMLSPMHLRKEEITIATLLRQAGYATCHVGKWHLNGMFNLTGQPQPNDHGFDYWFSTQNVALPSHRNPYNFVRNRIPVGPIEGYAAGIVAREAVHWLKDVRDRTKPFFQYICFHEPHEPIATDKSFTELYPSPDPSYAAYQGNITQMDHAFGELMAALDEQGLRENTLVFFTSDNGPAFTAIHPHGSKGPLRGKKGEVYEGGIRVPGILRWPGRARAGQVSDEPVSGVDWLPAICEITGLGAPRDRRIDGTSWLPALDAKPVARATPLYWHFNHAGSKPKVAMRAGDWKILAELTGRQIPIGADITAENQRAIKSAELGRLELYNLREDIGETRDRAADEPARLKEMAASLHKLYHEVRDESPVWPEWKFNRYDADRIEWPAYRKSPARQ